MCYVEYLGDGDSKAYNTIVKEKVCGEVAVQKLECVGHVQRRMGSFLQSLTKGKGKHLLKMAGVLVEGEG